ncbi:glycosyltransferase family 4 protein [Pseudomonas protegens]|uniref:glycosyltransferase family 4 protein n=1 Tax=Pseudomonas protegens TaxID=380021 RepID=UPI001E2FCFE6|nr:glycosyltransferase family 4 protein [Pseudomonas protegens]
MTKEAIRVARVSTVSFFIVTQLETQFEQLAMSGVDLTAISSADESVGRLLENKRFNFLPINIERKINIKKDILSLFLLIKAFRKYNFDIIHSTTPKAGLLCSIAGLFARRSVRLHTFTGQPWVTMSGLKRSLLRACDKLVGILNTHCYADSHSQMKFLISNGIIKPERISVLGAGSLAGIDLERFNKKYFPESTCLDLRSKLGISESSKVVLYVGRITPDKGINELVQAFERISAKDSDVFLVLVGPSEPEGQLIIDSIPEYIKSHVKVVGYDREPERYMAVADLLCLPSYREGFGTVIIEAGAMGIPSVGTDIYGLSDAILDGLTGLLVKVADPVSLEEGIWTLLSNPSMRYSMGAEAHRRASENFSSSRCSELLLKEYKAFIS